MLFYFVRCGFSPYPANMVNYIGWFSNVILPLHFCLFIHMYQKLKAALNSLLIGRPCQQMGFFIRCGLFTVLKDSHMSVFVFLFSLADQIPHKDFSLADQIPHSTSSKVKACFPLICCFMKEENIIVGHINMFPVLFSNVSFFCCPSGSTSPETIPPFFCDLGEACCLLREKEEGIWRSDFLYNLESIILRPLTEVPDLLNFWNFLEFHGTK